MKKDNRNTRKRSILTVSIWIMLLMALIIGIFIGGAITHIHLWAG